MTIPREVFEQTVLSFFDPIRKFLDDPTVSEVMINSFDEIWIESRPGDSDDGPRPAAPAGLGQTPAEQAPAVVPPGRSEADGGPVDLESGGAP